MQTVNRTNNFAHARLEEDLIKFIELFASIFELPLRRVLGVRVIRRQSRREIKRSSRSSALRNVEDEARHIANIDKAEYVTRLGTTLIH